MSDALEAAKLKAEKTYNAASDNFDAEPLAFWDRYGRRTIERMRLQPGARVRGRPAVSDPHGQCPAQIRDGPSP